MKVRLAIQSIASDSVARSLRWAHQNSLEGFEDKDVLTTAECFELQDKVFDILNCRSMWAPGYKQSLTEYNIAGRNVVLDQLWEMFSQLIDLYGDKIIKSRRKTGFLGVLVCIKSIRGLFHDLVLEKQSFDSISCYKFGQDHLEIFFANVRLQVRKTTSTV